MTNYYDAELKAHEKVSAKKRYNKLATKIEEGGATGSGITVKAVSGDASTDENLLTLLGLTATDSFVSIVSDTSDSKTYLAISDGETITKEEI